MDVYSLQEFLENQHAPALASACMAMCYNLRKNHEDTLGAMDEGDCRICQHAHVALGGLTVDLPKVNGDLDVVMRRFGRGSSDLASRSNEEVESPS